MKAREELVARLAQTRRAVLGDLSDAAYEELKLAVQEAPENFIDTPENQAFFLVSKAIDRFERDCRDRGADLSRAIHMYLSTAKPAYERYVEPFRAKADIIVCDAENDAALEAVARAALATAANGDGAGA